MRDAYDRGRLPKLPVRRGEDHPGVRLMDAQVVDIQLRLENGELGTLLAREFGVGPSTIYRIKNGARR
jgi:hypothetical protein